MERRCAALHGPHQVVAKSTTTSASPASYVKGVVAPITLGRTRDDVGTTLTAWSKALSDPRSFIAQIRARWRVLERSVAAGVGDMKAAAGAHSRKSSGILHRFIMNSCCFAYAPRVEAIQRNNIILIRESRYIKY